ncbi:hypothetical protein Leryth_018092 [Lithospermum erythrorhizon]|nr:hypothetical protein Leryth_018092 [Lithospermum erythrorhizon]
MEFQSNHPKQEQNNNNNINISTPKTKTLQFLDSISSLFNINSKNGTNIRIYENVDAEEGSPLVPIHELSPFSNSVVSRCAQILQTSAKSLQNHFDTEMPDIYRQPSSYARNFLEFCSYRALYRVTTSRRDYLSDRKFLRLIFDMMIAWESPGVETEVLDNGMGSPNNTEVDEEDGLSLFYSNSIKMAVEVDEVKTVGPEAFARIAPACSVIADISTVHNLFDALTSSSGHRLHFIIYSKYLRSLEKVIKVMQNGVGSQLTSTLSLAENEIILETDGTVPTQPVLQHVGISAWPGRLTMTSRALYFESGVGLYDKAVRYDLATDMKQTIKPELTGPLGVRLFDRAVMYKSTSVLEPVFLEFPEFRGSSRREYWLDISLEILRAHKFMRKYKLKEIQKFEALSRAILGVIRYRALREGFNVPSTNFRAVLCFNLAESLPRGDLILETLSRRLALMNPSAMQNDSVSPNSKRQLYSPIALLTLSTLGIKICDKPDKKGEANFLVGDVSVGESNPLEAAVNHSKQDSGKAEAARDSVEKVRLEGIDLNLAVLKELVLPFIQLFSQLRILASWQSPFKSIVFMVVVGYLILKYALGLLDLAYHSPTRPNKVKQNQSLFGIKMTNHLQCGIQHAYTIAGNGFVIYFHPFWYLSHLSCSGVGTLKLGKHWKLFKL